MRTLIALTVTVALLGLATPAIAHDFGVAGYYLDPHPEHAANDPVRWAEDASVWEESNGVDGLQRCAGTDNNGRPVPADTQVTGPAPQC